MHTSAGGTWSLRSTPTSSEKRPAIQAVHPAEVLAAPATSPYMPFGQPSQAMYGCTRVPWNPRGQLEHRSKLRSFAKRPASHRTHAPVAECLNLPGSQPSQVAAPGVRAVIHWKHSPPYPANGLYVRTEQFSQSWRLSCSTVLPVVSLSVVPAGHSAQEAAWGPA